MLEPGSLVYIAGPMRTLPNFNYPAFRAAAEYLRTFDYYAVIDPSTNFDGNQGLPWEDYMQVDLEHVLQADAVVVLPGWSKSVGATLECSVATATGKKVYALDNLNTPLPLTLHLGTEGFALVWPI